MRVFSAAQAKEQVHRPVVPIRVCVRRPTQLSRAAATASRRRLLVHHVMMDSCVDEEGGSAAEGECRLACHALSDAPARPARGPSAATVPTSTRLTAAGETATTLAMCLPVKRWRRSATIARPSLAVADGVELGVAPALRPADTMGQGPPFCAAGATVDLDAT